MMKQKNVVRIVSLFALSLGVPSCMADDVNGGLETGSATASLSSSDPAVGATSATGATEIAQTAGTHALSPISGSATALQVDWRINWPVAGLYNDDCSGSIREDMPSGTGIEYEGGVSSCSGEWRYYVTNLSTGHRGWVRAVALRSP